jgi:uncharacterized membrane protein
VDAVVRLRGWWDDLRDSLWLLPSITVLASAGLAAAMVALEPLPDAIPDGLVYGGAPDGARAVLGELAGATITVTGLVFSLTVIALQVASSQFSPRLLRTFLRNRGTQVVLSGMLGSAVYAVAVLRTVRAGTEDTDAFVPALAVTVALVYSLVAVGLLIFFLHHVTRHLRVDVVMREIAKQTIGRLQQQEREPELPDREPPEPPEEASITVARLDGYLQTADLDRLAHRLRELGAHARLRPAVGSWVTRGTVLAWWWPEDGAMTGEPDAVDGVLHANLHLGPDRTESDDIAFGVRQLTDIALRALSSGVNDPTTAVQAVEQLSAVLGAAARHPLGAVTVEDESGARVILPRPTFAAHLALAIDQVRAVGRDDTDLLVALLHLLTDLAELVGDSRDRRAVVAAQVDRVAAAVDLDDPEDRDRVERAITLARGALEGGTRPTAATEAG